MKTREVRKLYRNKSALLALAVILLYLATALFVMAGGITRDTCDTVVGPNKLPGFFRPETPERRYQNATKKFLSKVNRALAAEDVDVALKEVELGPFRVAEKSPAELKSVISQINAIADDLDQSPNLDDDPSLLPQLAELESVESQLKAPLGAWERFVYNAAICLGTDAQGRSIFFRGIYSIKIAIQIGLVTALFSVALGAFLGAAAGYFGGWVDHAVVWVYTTFSSIPNLVLLVVLAYAFTNSAVKDTLLPVYIAFGATFWIGTCRVIRGETLKLKEMEYVHAAQTAGFGPMHILLRHIIPNTAHLMLINFSLLLIAAIKSEVILSFLGFGVKNQPSWGIMIRDAGNNGDVIKGFFWEIGFATALMFVLVLAFNILSDALQDAFDPKHV
jgi:peptide/nickel transport system permease protein